MSEAAPDIKKEDFDRTAMEVLTGIGKTIGQISLYNRPEHPSVQAMLIHVYERLKSLFGGKTTSLVYSLMGDRVVVNGQIIASSGRLPGMLTSFFIRNKIQSVTLKDSITPEDLTALCTLATARPGKNAKTPAEVLEEKGIKSVAFNEAELAVLMKGERVDSGASQVGKTEDGERKKMGEEAGEKGSRVDSAFVRNNFGRHIAPELLDELAECADRLKLGGETRTLTVMFTDIRGFTSLAEDMTPQEVTRFINAFLTPMTRVIMEYGGYIDKYIGDCIMAFWNAPLEEQSHQFKAATAAIAMRAELAKLNQGWLQEAIQRRGEFKPVQIGIGVNTGECCVGNIGSEQRFEYSALGDAVNLASRLEGQSKTYGVDIVLSSDVQKEIPDYATLELDILRVKGKKKPIQIFGLLGDHELTQSEAFQHLARVHSGFLEAFRGGRWDEAERFMKACRTKGFPLDTLYDLYQSRIAALRRRPPAPGWDGVFTATEK